MFPFSPSSYPLIILFLFTFFLFSFHSVFFSFHTFLFFLTCLLFFFLLTLPTFSLLSLPNFLHILTFFIFSAFFRFSPFFFLLPVFRFYLCLLPHPFHSQFFFLTCLAPLPFIPFSHYFPISAFFPTHLSRKHLLRNAGTAGTVGCSRIMPDSKCRRFLRPSQETNDDIITCFSSVQKLYTFIYLLRTWYASRCCTIINNPPVRQVVVIFEVQVYMRS